MSGYFINQRVGVVHKAGCTSLAKMSPVNVSEWNPAKAHLTPGVQACPACLERLPVEDCESVGFSGQGRCVEPAHRDGLCVEHLTRRPGILAGQTPGVDLIRRLRSLRANYSHRAEHLPHPPLSWSDATADLDDVLAALDGHTWMERRGL